MSFFHFSFCNLFSINSLAPFLSPHLLLTNRANVCKLACYAVSQKALFWNSVVPKKLSCWLPATYNRNRLTGLCGHFEHFYISCWNSTTYRRSTWNNLSAFHVEHHNTGHLEHFPGVPILSPKRRFSPVFSLFGGSAVRVGRRSAE